MISIADGGDSSARMIFISLASSPYVLFVLSVTALLLRVASFVAKGAVKIRSVTMV